MRQAYLTQVAARAPDHPVARKCLLFAATAAAMPLFKAPSAATSRATSRTTSRAGSPGTSRTHTPPPQPARPAPVGRGDPKAVKDPRGVWQNYRAPREGAYSSSSQDGPRAAATAPEQAAVPSHCAQCEAVGTRANKLSRSTHNLHDKKRNDGLFYCEQCWRKFGCPEGRPNGETETYPQPTDELGGGQESVPASRAPVEPGQ